jgi:protein Mpv17
VFGPAATTWYKALQHRINLSSTNGTILARVAADQFVFAPINLGFFLSSMAILEGSDPKKKIDNAYWPALSTNWLVWPWVQMLNFKLVPLHHRVLVVNIVSLGWNCYLSWVNSK